HILERKDLVAVVGFDGLGKLRLTIHARPGPENFVDSPSLGLGKAEGLAIVFGGLPQKLEILGYGRSRVCIPQLLDFSVLRFGSRNRVVLNTLTGLGGEPLHVLGYQEVPVDCWINEPDADSENQQQDHKSCAFTHSILRCDRDRIFREKGRISHREPARRAASGVYFSLESEAASASSAGF